MAKKVLLVDDNTMVVATYRSLLRAAGLEVSVATDGQAALDLALSERPDLILLDIQLPKRNGLEVLTTLRGTPGIEATPVIVFTQSYAPAVVQRAWDAGATSVIAKGTRTPKQIVADVQVQLGGAA